VLDLILNPTTLFLYLNDMLHVLSYNVLIDAYGVMDLMVFWTRLSKCCVKWNLMAYIPMLLLFLPYLAAKMCGIKVNTVVVLTLYKSMRKRKVLPDFITNNVLISCCCSSTVLFLTSYLLFLLQSIISCTLSSHLHFCLLSFELVRQPFID